MTVDIPTVSVVMNGLNAQTYLREAIDSVYSQTFHDWEIVLWDNASTDGTGDIARSYDGRLRYFRDDTTVPLGAARNKALSMARGAYIAFLDCDDIWLPSKLERQVPLFDDPEVDLVYSDAIYFGANQSPFRLYSRYPHYEGRCFGDLLVYYCLAMPTVVIRRAALARQPYWFGDAFQVSEESELFLRLAHDGKVAMVDEPLARYRLHAGSWTAKRPELFDIEREVMLEGFSRLYPGFMDRYADQIDVLRRTQSFSVARRQWMAGQNAAARATLRPYLDRMRPRLLYAATYAPAGIGRALDTCRTMAQRLTRRDRTA